MRRRSRWKREVDAREDAVDDVAADVLCCRAGLPVASVVNRPSDGARRAVSSHNRYDDARQTTVIAVAYRSVFVARLHTCRRAILRRDGENAVASMDDGTRNNALIDLFDDADQLPACVQQPR